MEALGSRLAALLSADIAGYSRLMADDENATIEMVRSRRHEVARLLEKHRGRLVDFTGDNFMAEFASAVDAVECAVAIQEIGLDLNAHLPPERRMEFRIGLHLGEVQVDEDRIFGHGVNVAARIEALGDPGGICVSPDIVRQVKGRTSYYFRNLGKHHVKNIREPVRVYAVETQAGAGEAPRLPPTSRLRVVRSWKGVAATIAAAVFLVGAGWGVGFSSATYGREHQPPRSLIVLPFDDLSPLGDQDHVARGLRDELIGTLSRAPGLRVKGRTMGAAARSAALDIPEIGERTGVRGVIEGSVREWDGRLRISIQVVAAEDGTSLWSQSFERPSGDLFALQQDVALSVTEALQSGLGATDADSSFARGAAEGRTTG